MDTYSDSDLVCAAGLPMLHVRRLITWGAVTPVGGGKGVVRQWKRAEIRHVACVTALYNAGLSLPMAHTLGMLIPARVALNLIDPESGIRPGVLDKWFNPQVPLPVVEKADVILTIINGYSVFWQLGVSERFFVGKLSEDRSIFLSALDYSNFQECNPGSLSWEYLADFASEHSQAEAADEYRHPVSANRVNLSLACKIAMRRLLGIPVFFKTGRK